MSLPQSSPLPATPDQAFDRLTRLVRTQLEVPVALVSLVSVAGQVFPGASGLPEPWQSERSTPLSHSFCQHVVGSSAPLVITDARQEPLVRENLAVPELGVIAYAGMPLLDAGGTVVGSLCAIDHQPRRWTPAELAFLDDLAAACSSELQLRTAQDEARRADRHSRALLTLSEALGSTITVQDVAGTVANVALRELEAACSGVALLEASGGTLRYVSQDTLPGAAADSWREFGIDEEIPTATAVRTGAAVFYRDNEQLLADYPQLRADPTVPLAQGRAMLPLLAGSRVIGAIMLAWREPHEVGVADRSVLAALARYTAQAIQRAQLLRERREVAETLQRSMLGDLPAVPGLQLQATYVPASAGEQVGGDWYDAVLLPDGATALAIGDVTGHDMTAAAAMGQLHTLLRAFAYDRQDAPSEVVARLDQTIRGLRLQTVATALLARLEEPADPATGRLLRWSSAGHPPPVLLLPDGTTQVPDAKPDLLLGIDPDAGRHDHELLLPPGSTLLLYTDGLVEHRGQSLTDGIEELRAVLTEHRDQPLEALLGTLVELLVRDRSRDDCAILAVRLPDRPVP